MDGHATKARGVLGLGGGGDEVCSDLNVCGELKWKDWIGWGGFLWMSECVRECGREGVCVSEGVRRSISGTGGDRKLRPVGWSECVSV